MHKQHQNELGTKNNILINARYKIGLSEMRLLLLILAKVRNTEADFNTYRLPVKDLIGNQKKPTSNDYERARRITKSLMSKVMEVETRKGPLQLSFFSSVQYCKEKGDIELRFDKALKPFLLQLREEFTEYDIRNILPCRSVYSMRFYELLQAFQGATEKTIPLDRLRVVLGIEEKYILYADLKRYVLKTAEKELKKHSDVYFEFKEIKKGKRVDSIKIIINRRNKLRFDFDKPKYPNLRALPHPPAPSLMKQNSRGRYAGAVLRPKGAPIAAGLDTADQKIGSHYQYIDGVLKKDGEEIWVDEFPE